MKRLPDMLQRRIDHAKGTVARLARSPVHREAALNNLLKEMSYTHGLLESLGHPQIFQLETTNACPYTCGMCPRTHGMTRPIGHMDPKLLDDILAQIRPAWQVDGFSEPVMRLLHFGEPFVYKYFVEAIHSCHAHGLGVYISTNPSVWTDRRIDETIEAGVDDLTVVIDGMDDETSMAIRGRVASFSRGERNLRELARRKVARGAKKPRILVMMVKQLRNRHQWEHFARHWAQIDGIDAITFAPFSTFAGDIEAINDLSKQLAAAEPEAEDRRQLDKARDLAAYPCYYPWHSVTVTWDGKVVACCRDYDAAAPLGDLTRERLDTIWNGAAIRRLRREFLTRDIRTALCAGCKEPSLEIGLPRLYPLPRWRRRPVTAPTESGGAIVPASRLVRS